MIILESNSLFAIFKQADKISEYTTVQSEPLLCSFLISERSHGEKKCLQVLAHMIQTFKAKMYIDQQ